MTDTVDAGWAPDQSNSTDEQRLGSDGNPLVQPAEEPALQPEFDFLHDDDRQPAVGIMAGRATTAVASGPSLRTREAVDRLAERGTAVAQALGQHVSAAAVTLEAQTVVARDVGRAWMEQARTTVRRKPLASIAAAVALGALIVRATR